MIRCDVCGGSKGHCVRYNERSSLSICSSCIDEACIHATKEEMMFMMKYVALMRDKNPKCIEGTNFGKRCYNKIATVVWMKKFGEWIVKNRKW